ncbi:fimbrial protein [Achromobacter sp. MFA1 R4]|uniref:fimbrial protein n=1 Tax=Achromobacter sp. MFA1 R4 TaxID=1881016 RepID=UPI0009536FD0|nr:fimbrial protein [Achromobacter sp. MFA1 R4]SIT13691.1 major type 1 subunit fimbrin (pilin) [Achromobacter sp. MFA1 R4]
MKLRILGISIAAALGAVALPASAAQVGTGKVNFEGTLIPNTCKVAPASEDQTVLLPTVSTQSLITEGDTAGSRAFEIDVIECPDTIDEVQAHFEITNMEPKYRTLKNLESTGAQNVTVQLLEADGTPIQAGSAGTAFPVTGAGATRGATLVYGGQYFSLGGATSGVVKTFAEFTLAYP